MTFAAPPAKTEISGTPSPTNAAANAGFGKLHDFVYGLFGTTGKPDAAYAAMKMLDSKVVMNLKPTFSVASNALTITVKGDDGNSLSDTANPGFVGQRSSTIGDGGFNLRKITADIAMTVSSGSTLGHTSGFLWPIYIYLIDNAGAQELAVSGSFYGESGIVTTTAEGGAGGADTKNTMYSTTARSNLPFRLIAIAFSNQTTAGTWTSNPSKVKRQPFNPQIVGATEDFKGPTVPYGYFLEDGSNVSRSTYAELFAAIGTTWGVGDGSTTFGLPDSRRRTSVGSGGTGSATLANSLGSTGGAETHTLVSGEMPSHVHAKNQGNNTGGPPYSHQASNFLNTQNTNSTGGDGAHNNMQPSMVVTKMIRWLGDVY